jgi:uncharacterized repeat protein (TIGR03803 family)
VGGQTNYQQLMIFGSPRLPGVGGTTPLVWANPGVLYGTTANSTNSEGCLFSVRPDGSEQRAWSSYWANYWASSGLVLGLKGAIYGMNTDYVFKWDESGLTNLYMGSSQGYALTCSLIQGRDGTLFGTAGGGGTKDMGTIFRLNPDGSGFQVMHDFAGAPSDGNSTQSGLILGADGMLYGDTIWGGTHDAGTVFRIKTDGSGYEVLHNFNATNGAYYKSALVQGVDGMLYGTTIGGGSVGQVGVVFKLSTNGSDFSVIHGFSTVAYQSVNPSSLIQGPDGALYGTTQYGGITNPVSTYGMGTVFKLNTDGSNYTVLYEFSGEDGRNPKSSLLAGADGALYGTTQFGGFFDQGTVFKLSPSPSSTGVFIDYYASAGGFNITLSAGPAQTWSLQFSANPGMAGSWQTVETVRTDTFGLIRFTNLSGKGCYRAIKQ